MKALERTLQYDENRWEEATTEPVNTLQLFITNRCNLRCRACFYAGSLGKKDMSMEQYKEHVLEHKEEISKVILLGGEPTLHPDLEQMLFFSKSQGLRTTVYTNGARITRLEGFDLKDVEVRVGIYGSVSSEKPLGKIARVSFPFTVVYMLRKDNVNELMEAAEMADSLGSPRFFISSIRDIAKTGSYWIDNEETVPLEQYADIVQDFVDNYKGGMELHIAKRGVLKSQADSNADKCRFGNIFPDDSKIICPFDISLEKYSSRLCFDKRRCNKNKSCLLTKIVLKPKMADARRLYDAAGSILRRRDEENRKLMRDVSEMLKKEVKL
ncbi:MAG: radical SAM protein [Nanoarchaeota archaeon]|nr:radical SAM protein [Nanoarchaeota archaeon]